MPTNRRRPDDRAWAAIAERKLLDSLELLLFSVEDLASALQGHTAWSSAKLLGAVLRHGLACAAWCRVLGRHLGVHRIARVREADGVVLAGKEYRIDGLCGSRG